MNKYPKPETEAPDFEQLNEWLHEGGCESTNDCYVDHDGICEHCFACWLIYLDLI